MTLLHVLQKAKPEELAAVIPYPPDTGATESWLALGEMLRGQHTELAADIMEHGIMLAGGGALLAGLPERLAYETGMPIRIAENPLYAVALGSGQSLEEFDALKGVLFSSTQD